MCDSLDISIALVAGTEAAHLYGIDRLPAVVYFEDGKGFFFVMTKILLHIVNEVIN